MHAPQLRDTVVDPAADPASQQLRTTLQDLPDDDTEYGAWWATEPGAWLFNHLTFKIGEPLANRFSRQYGAAIDAGDVTNTAVLMLARSNVRNGVRQADNQWAYLYRMLCNEMLAQVGTMGTGGIDLDQLEIVAPPTDQVTLNMENAIARTTETLLPLTPTPVRRHLPEVIAYLAERGQSRLSHAYTASARDHELTSLGLTRKQILALANVVLGARPHHGRTSLLAGFLVDDDWNPAQSVEHVNALNKYRTRMLRESIAAAAASMSEQALVEAV